MKLFVSYARVDKPLCKQIAEHLQDVHEVWYDRRLHAGQDWWDEIVRRLRWCDSFVYLLSPESVVSPYCQREYKIASDAGKPVIPVLIQARTEIPETLKHLHYADLSEGMEDIVTLLNALTVAERQLGPRSSLSTPASPAPQAGISPNAALTEAADAMENEQFDTAVFILKQALSQNPGGRVARILRTMLQDAETALEKQTSLREAAREYAPILELTNRAATRTLGCAEFAEFQQQFPGYDPDNIAAICAEAERSKPRSHVTESRLMPSLTSEVKELLDVIASAQSEPRARAEAGRKLAQLGDPRPGVGLRGDGLPDIDWIEIPAGEFLMGSDKALDPAASDDEVPQHTVYLETLSISRYPITVAQYEAFVNDGGYAVDKYWTDRHGDRRQPRDYWNVPEWHIANHPVVGVTWYEAYAFTQWLSAKLGVQAALPTEAQWEKAARGAEARIFPYEGEFDPAKGNTGETGIGRTTAVGIFPTGASPFGVLDMSGNVWEWCLTKWRDRYNRPEDNDPRSYGERVVRGGSWVSLRFDARAVYRNRNTPYAGNSNFGFRVVRVPHP